MYSPAFGLGIPANLSNENQLRSVFNQIMTLNGVFLFNVSGVNLRQATKGFRNYDEAEESNLITEWELSTILANNNFRKNCIFHNGKVEFKKRILWRAVR